MDDEEPAPAVMKPPASSTDAVKIRYGYASPGIGPLLLVLACLLASVAISSPQPCHACRAYDPKAKSKAPAVVGGVKMLVSPLTGESAMGARATPKLTIHARSRRRASARGSDGRAHAHLPARPPLARRQGQVRPCRFVVCCCLGYSAAACCCLSYSAAALVIVLLLPPWL